jgi:hypothetical protein
LAHSFGFDFAPGLAHHLGRFKTGQEDYVEMIGKEFGRLVVKLFNQMLHLAPDAVCRFFKAALLARPGFTDF